MTTTLIVDCSDSCVLLLMREIIEQITARNPMFGDSNYSSPKTNYLVKLVGLWTRIIGVPTIGLPAVICSIISLIDY